MKSHYLHDNHEVSNQANIFVCYFKSNGLMNYYYFYYYTLDNVAIFISMASLANSAIIESINSSVFKSVQNGGRDVSNRLLTNWPEGTAIWSSRFQTIEH